MAANCVYIQLSLNTITSILAAEKSQRSFAVHNTTRRCTAVSSVFRPRTCSGSTGDDNGGFHPRLKTQIPIPRVCVSRDACHRSHTLHPCGCANIAQLQHGWRGHGVRGARHGRLPWQPARSDLQDESRHDPGTPTGIQCCFFFFTVSHFTVSTVRHFVRSDGDALLLHCCWPPVPSGTNGVNWRAHDGMDFMFPGE